jgi:adenine-specific DNA-methyltransferase
MIIEGDNLEVLKSLVPRFRNKIKCVYIDPPYNTGSENWIYNDNVTDPKILKWLGQVVGKEEDDFTRHDKWLCMMYPRLRLLHDLLSRDGIILIHIDDNELHNLIAVMNEIFGIKNQLAVLVWNLGTGTSAGHFTRAHEYILAYAKNKSLLENFKGGEGFIDDRALKKIGKKNSASEFTFPKGTKFLAADGIELTGDWGGSEKTTLVGGRMIAKDGKLMHDVTLSAGWTQKKQMISWFQGKETVDSKGQEVTEFYFRSNGKLYCRKKRERVNPSSVLESLGSSKTANAELQKIFEDKQFDYPKPLAVAKFLIDLVTSPGDYILDAFAGSGTTGHAVLSLNDTLPGRKFILIQQNEMDEMGREVKICEQITAARIKTAITGYEGAGALEGTFNYYTLGERLFNADGMLNPAVPLNEIKEYIWFSETQTELQLKEGSFLGCYRDTAYYIFYNPNAPTTLNFENLSSNLSTKASSYIIYADNCLLPSDFMEEHNIIFKKIPRDITHF